ncbi:hypothetical protein ElyMa_001609800 [Elysia marginata]|uniref:Uncharacterized protein n=1 Tax=Elysia marginata TaxID=1093978 RepID=A0AAV4JJU3_9GAST|nr:hypothetical protein ElyMa_001609800 [Elysia marginata]
MTVVAGIAVVVSVVICGISGGIDISEAPAAVVTAMTVAVVICGTSGSIDISEAPMAVVAAIAIATVVGVMAYGTNGSIRNTKR